jgi:putative restriction endonuclease
MSLPQTQTLHTVEEYLAIERKSEERHEYLDGLIYAMAGESPEHGIVCVNLTRTVSTQLLGTPCQVFAKDLKVRSGPDPKSRRVTKGLFSYADLVVVCGELQVNGSYPQSMSLKARFTSARLIVHCAWQMFMTASAFQKSRPGEDSESGISVLEPTA